MEKTKEEKKLRDEKLVVTVRLIEPQLGTVPKDKEVYKTFIETKRPVEQEGTEESADIQEIEEKGWTGFMHDEEGLYVFNYMIKGFLKHAGNTLKENLGVKNLRSKLDDYVFIYPRKLRFKLNGHVVAKVEETLERPLRAMTMQGPRVTLARSDIVPAGSELTFEVVIIGNKSLDSETILNLLYYGKLMGLGQFRNGGYGAFEVVAVSHENAPEILGL